MQTANPIIKMSEEKLKDMEFETRAIHAGQSADQWTNREVIPPIALSTTFEHLEPGVAVSFKYSRGGNATRRSLESCLAAVEGAKYGKL